MNPAPVSAVSINIDYADHTARIPVAGNTSLQVTGSTSTLITGVVLLLCPPAEFNVTPLE